MAEKRKWVRTPRGWASYDPAITSLERFHQIQPVSVKPNPNRTLADPRKHIIIYPGN